MIKYLIKQVQNFDEKSVMLDGYFFDEYYDHPIVNVNDYYVTLIDDNGNKVKQIQKIRFAHIKVNNPNPTLPNYAYNVCDLDIEPKQGWSLLFEQK